VNPRREHELALRLAKQGTVETCAARLAKRYAGLVSDCDLMSLGNTAAAEVVREYVDGRSAFEAFSLWRIQRAMLTGIRVEALERRVDKAALRAQAELLALYEGDPSAAPLDRLERLADAVAAATFVAMAQEAQRGGDADMVAREEYAAAMEVIAAVMGALPRPQHKLFVLVYCEGCSLVEAQAKLGVHYNTVLRWHDLVLGAVKKKLEQGGITHRPTRGGAPRVAVLGVVKGEGETPR
jgi:DNA-directed RNA polymerase specialized sigma24 family protein